MPVNYTKIKRIIEKSKTTGFRGMSLDSVEEINTEIHDASKADAEIKLQRSFKSLKQVQEESVKAANKAAITIFASKDSAQPKSIKQIYDASFSTHDSVYNDRLNIGNRADAATDVSITPNIWISPWEAAAVYSQKGLIETVINKKSKSIMLNGIKIQNPRLTAKQIDKISENFFAKASAQLLSDNVCNALVYGGGLMFPMFKKDTPLTMNLPMSSLLKNGVLGKDCIDRFISLDRWNTMIIPAKSPTQRDFEKPESFYIPYLGQWVSGQRCSRIITSKQPGWFGYMFNQGWGLSDITGYYKEFCDYTISIRQIPLMLKQMSILVRTINPDGVLATEGSNALDTLLEDSSIHMRDVSANNPIQMDVIGELTSINRDFAEVVALMRLLQQDFGAKANVPAPLIWSYEKGAFSSGDDTEGQLSKQWEATKYMHKDVEIQLKPFAMMMVIDTLGATAEVISALPYTQIKFDTPLVASAVERANVGKSLAEAMFEYVGSQVPMDKALAIVSNFATDDMSISSDMLDELKERQAKLDDLSQRKQELEIEKLQKEIDYMDKTQSTQGEKVPSSSSSKEKKEGYSRLEQKQHEKTRADFSKRNEMKAKSEGKINRVKSTLVGDE